MPFVDISKISLPDSLETDFRIRGLLNSYGHMTKEAYAKRLKYHKEMQRILDGGKGEGWINEDILKYYQKNKKFLDDIVEEKGVDSQIAVVYIDGNSMGAKVEGITK